MASNLSAFDKINLAACAVRRAQLTLTQPDRFRGEWDTMRVWRDHRCANFSDDGKLSAYVHC